MVTVQSPVTTSGSSTSGPSAARTNPHQRQTTRSSARLAISEPAESQDRNGKFNDIPNYFSSVIEGLEASLSRFSQIISSFEESFFSERRKGVQEATMFARASSTRGSLGDTPQVLMGEGTPNLVALMNLVSIF